MTVIVLLLLFVLAALGLLCSGGIAGSSQVLRTSPKDNPVKNELS
jgi:hypothetical protein